jgi:hypothetical protein
MQPDSGTPWSAKIVLGVLVVGLVVAGVAYFQDQSSSPIGDPKAEAARQARQKAARLRALQAKKKELAEQTNQVPPASAGSNGTTQPPPETSAGGASSFAKLEQELPAQIGVAVAPFGSSPPQQFGSLSSGHAWSSFKVPIVVTLMQRGSLSASDQAQARAAIAASDNAAAASLFSQLGSTTTASRAVESVLAKSGYPTAVATAPPPSGAVSTWGQTDWSLVSSAGFYRALACGQLLDSRGTSYVLGLMEEVIPEQQWGLGEAGIPGQVAFKAGWGPGGSASGPYLVRQSGVIRSGSSGAAVTIAAQDESGSFDAGVQDLNAVAAWVRDNVHLTAGTC